MLIKNNRLKSSAFTLIKFAIGWPLSAAALFFIAKVILSNSNKILPNLKNPNWLVLLFSLIFFFAFYFIRAVVWKIILKNQGHEIPLKEVYFLWEISELKRFIPGNIWSFLGRAYQFAEKGITAKTIAKSMIIEIEFFLLASAIVSVFGLHFVFGNFFILLIAILLLALVMPIFIFSSSFSNKYLKTKPFSLIRHLLPMFSPKINLLLLLISFLYTFFFGLGTYFAITSITYLSPSYVIQLIGFFVFSFLVGYLSLVVPMGLGIREGIITLGLSKILPLTTAAFVSIYARIALIISELIFLIFAYFWKKTKISTSLITLHKHEIILVFFILLYIIYFTTASFLRFDNFFAGRFDLGNMDQTVWNTIHGRIFELTDPNGTNIISRLDFHADFILILISPLYLLWSSPKILLLLQTIVLAGGSIFVYKIAKDTLKNKNLSLVFGISFLFYPGLEFVNLYDFHGVALATTFLLGAFYFLRKNNYLWFLFFAILSGLTKEHVWVIISLFGLYIVFSKTNKIKRSFGIIIFIASIVIFYYLVWHAIPNALGSKHFALSYYSDFGDSPTRIVKNFFLSPQKIFRTFFQKDQIHYLQQLLLPVGFLSLISPYLLFALPDLLINLLSNNSQLHEIFYQYSALITPFIFIAAIFAVKDITKWFPKINPNIYISYIVMSTLLSCYLFGPLPGGNNPSIDMFTKPQLNKKIIEDFISNIPSKYSIAATNNIGSHLSHRQKIFTIPLGIDKADYIIFLLNDLSAQPSLQFQKDIANKIRSDKNYIEIFKDGDFVVFKKQNLFVRFSYLFKQRL